MYAIELTEEVRAWIRALRDRRAKARIVSRLHMAGLGSLGDWRPVTGRICEMRIDVGCGYRLYFMRRGRTVVVILAGGDKSSQRRDIERSIRIAAEMERHS